MQVRVLTLYLFDAQIHAWQLEIVQRTTDLTRTACPFNSCEVLRNIWKVLHWQMQKTGAWTGNAGQRL
jgi:hypothetical protein